MPLPPLDTLGDLPIGVHIATLDEVLAAFGQSTDQRLRVGLRLRRVYELARSTGCVVSFIVFGSFVTAKLDPNDIDVFLVMSDDFDVGRLSLPQKLVFEHAAAQAKFGASVFWVRRAAAHPSVEELISGWGITRDGTVRGIVTIVEGDA